jgi:thymidylate synthase ThyX
MTITASVVLDSISPRCDRLTTFQLRYPRFIHDELLTHRVFSRNASSARAIPVKAMIEDVDRDPVYPIHWGRNVPGMSAREELTGSALAVAKRAWNNGMQAALGAARAMAAVEAHKQFVNRVLMPYQHINVVVTATEFMNFFGLRLDVEAQPEIRALADVMWRAYLSSTPGLRYPGEWHLPFVSDEDWAKGLTVTDTIVKLSVARCARVSRLSFKTGLVSTVKEDLELYDKLLAASPIHASPAEHQATPDQWSDRFKNFWSHPEEHGNFTGWRQYRKMLPGEAMAPLPPEYA